LYIFIIYITLHSAKNSIASRELLNDFIIVFYNIWIFLKYLSYHLIENIKSNRDVLKKNIFSR